MSPWYVMLQKVVRRPRAAVTPEFQTGQGRQSMSGRIYATGYGGRIRTTIEPRLAGNSSGATELRCCKVRTQKVILGEGRQ